MSVGLSDLQMVSRKLRYLSLEAHDRGLRPDELFGNTQQRRDLLRDAETTTDLSYRDAIECAIGRLGDPALGLAVGARQPATSYGLLGLGFLSCGTLADVLAMGATYLPLAEPTARCRIEVAGDGSISVVESATGSSAVDAFVVDRTFASALRVGRDTTKTGFTPRRVEFDRPRPGNADVYESHFGVPVIFGASRNALHIGSAERALPIPTADGWTCAAVTARLDERLAKTAGEADIAVRLSAHVAAALPEMRPLSTHARALAMSERTLRRRLDEAGTSYSLVVESVRQKLVADLLPQQQLSLTSIAMRAGYGDDRSLRRAVQRWYGRSPNEVRRSLAAAYQRG